jgi:neutral ceramidase
MITLRKIFRQVKRVLIWILKIIAFFILAVLLFVAAILLPIDRTPYKEKEFYGKMMKRLDSLGGSIAARPAKGFSTGFAKANITPSFPVATAGYGNRRGKNFTSVLDSVFVRAAVVQNGAEKVAIVSADLLIIPPEVTEQLKARLPSVGFTINNTYLSASHTHNSIGNWGVGATRFIYGDYSKEVVDLITDGILNSIKKASADLAPSSFRNGSIAVPNVLRNRLDKTEGTIDSLLHLVEITRADRTKVAIITFNAHATCLFSRDLELSRDYPGELVDKLESDGYTFAMFMSGAVGSHGCRPPEFGRPCIGWMADEILNKVNVLRDSLQPTEDSSLQMIRIPLELGEPQVKISEDWRIRPWVFKAAFGEYKPYLTALRIGKIIFLGTPCDFSGELTKPIRALGASGGFQVIVTSFNGNYIGYITDDKYYDRSHYETRLMNWYGPGNGAYLTECLLEETKALMKSPR